jgi:signal transduction histidine kinase
MELIQHMSRTIDDFRSYFKPEKEKVEFSAHEAVAKTLSLMEGSFNQRQIRIEVEAKDDPLIHGYPNEFSQVLLNILNNARDAFAGKGIAAPRVTVRLFAENGRTIVTVADNAGGIPEETLAKIFDPYFTTKGPQGTGIGLYMAKSIIEKNMHGTLTALNSGEGAEFRIEVESAAR